MLSRSDVGDGVSKKLLNAPLSFFFSNVSDLRISVFLVKSSLLMRQNEDEEDLEMRKCVRLIVLDRLLDELESDDD